MPYAVAVDIGGTFTDLVAYDAETSRVAYAKSPTTYGNLVEGKDLSIDGRIVPYAVFTDPQLGRVGMTESEARATGRPLKIGTIQTGIHGAPKLLYCVLKSIAPGGGAFHAVKRLSDLPAMLGKLHRGLFVTETMGQGTNALTGDFSVAIKGFWVDHGQIVHPVEEMTIAGNMKDMLREIVAVGSDVHVAPVRNGSILVENMKVAGHA